MCRLLKGGGAGAENPSLGKYSGKYRLLNSQLKPYTVTSFKSDGFQANLKLNSTSDKICRQDSDRDPAPRWALTGPR